MDYDVIVVGGGISGTIAAIASARCGAKTLVIEQYGFLGGMLTAGGVGPMMTFHAGEKLVVQGITNELVDRLVTKNMSPGHILDTKKYTYTITPFDAEGMKHELEIMLLESGGEILYHTMLAGVEVSDGRILSVKVCNKAGISQLQAKTFIDATGDADLSVWAGVPFTKGREGDGASMPMTMNMKVRNVDIRKVKEYIRNNPGEFPELHGDVDVIDKAGRLAVGGYITNLKTAKERGEVTGARGDLLFFETNYEGEVIVNTTRIVGRDSTEPWSLTWAEIEGRKFVREIQHFLNNEVVGFEKAVLEFSGPAVGVRSSRQIQGAYTLTVEDLVECRHFKDVIAHGGYPIDIHPPKGDKDRTFKEKSKKIKHLMAGEVYGIPYRSLVNHVISNLVTVGRCISCTFEAQGGIRVTPIAGAIGHAGGVAAAMASKGDIHTAEVDIRLLQQELREQGAYLEID